MSPLDIAVAAGGLVLIVFLAWYFFAPRKAAQAQVSGGVQVVDITVRGGYSPDLMRVRAGTPVRLRFDRQDNSDCTSRVVFPDLRKSASLAAFGTTSVDLRIEEAGSIRGPAGRTCCTGG